MPVCTWWSGVKIFANCERTNNSSRGLQLWCCRNNNDGFSWDRFLSLCYQWKHSHTTRQTDNRRSQLRSNTLLHVSQFFFVFVLCFPKKKTFNFRFRGRSVFHFVCFRFSEKLFNMIWSLSLFIYEKHAQICFLWAAFRYDFRFR